MSTVPEVDLFEQPVPDANDPAARAGAAANFIECSHGISNGGWSPDFGPTGSASNPEGGLAQFLDAGLFGLPREGYAVSGRSADRMLFTYSVAEVPKVAVIVGDGTAVQVGVPEGWAVETFATCDPAEFDPSAETNLPIEVWVDTEGNRIPTSIIVSSPGPEHCGWESVTFLQFQDRQYIRDPRGVIDGPFDVLFANDVDLPGDATDTGYRRDEQQLWISGDLTVAYLVKESGVEAWPSPKTPDPIACA